MHEKRSFRRWFSQAKWSHQQAIIDEKDKKIALLEKLVNQDTKNSDAMDFNIKMIWDEETQEWFCIIYIWGGLIEKRHYMAAETLDLLWEKIGVAIPEILRLNRDSAPFHIPLQDLEEAK